MARTLFGTDGIRGVAGEYPLDPKTANAVGIALGKWVLRSKQEPRVVIGMDTRESGPWIAAEVAGGLESQGVSVNFAGITTTPGVAYLAKTGPYAAGVMISASHNPYRDNGIKLIGHSGYKLPGRAGRDSRDRNLRAASRQRSAFRHHSSRWILVSIAPTSNIWLRRCHKGWAGCAIVCDCANGSASALAPELFERLGASVHDDALCSRRPQYQSQLRVPALGSAAGGSVGRIG